jgi:hypothetical protein
MLRMGSGGRKAVKMTKWTPAKMGRKGGKARAAKMTPEERSERMRQVVQTRWKKAKGKLDIRSAV